MFHPGVPDQFVVNAGPVQGGPDVLALGRVDQRVVPADEALPPGQRNLVRWMFTTEQARQVYLDWKPEAQAMLARFRLAPARHPGDPGSPP